jgi:hypothetical protein
MHAKWPTLFSLPLVIVALVGQSRAQAPDEAALEQPTTQTTNFLESLSSNVEGAYDTLLKESPIGHDQERLKKVIAETKRLFASSAVYGKPRTEKPVERVKAQIVGNDLAILRYLYKFDQLPVVWHFSLYRTNGKWVVVGVRFDHEYELLAQ